MSMKEMQNNKSIQDIRDDYIHALSESKNSSQLALQLADDLFALDLTVYSKNYSFESLVYNSFSRSVLDDSISLHPEQLNIIKHIEELSHYEYVGQKEKNRHKKKCFS